MLSLKTLTRICSCLGLCLLATPALAIDGSTMSATASGPESAGPLAMETSESMSATSADATSYYESLLSVAGAEAFAPSEPGLPTSLAIYDSTAVVSYVPGRSDDRWTLKLRGLNRPHERVDAVFQMIAVLPLPFDDDDDGREAAFATRSFGIRPREGTPGNSVPLIYGGEKVILKRNLALEKALLPGLVGRAGEGDKLPSLEGTGYDYTLWDTIVRYDSSHGDTLQVLADVPYVTDDDVSPPDAEDDRLKAYVITWIPGVDPRHAVFTVRIDIAEPAE